MTPKRFVVLDFIAVYFGQRGYYPTFDEIRSGLKYNSLSTVHKHIYNLVGENLLTLRGRRQKRGIRFTHLGLQVAQRGGSCPVCGNKRRTDHT